MQNRRNLFPDCSDFAYLSGGAFGTTAMRLSEVKIASILNWSFHHPTLFHFAQFCVTHPHLPEGKQEKLRAKMWNICIRALFHTKVIHTFHPHVVGCAAFECAMDAVGVSSSGRTCAKRVQALWRVSDSSMRKCKHALLQCFEAEKILEDVSKVLKRKRWM